MLITLKNDMFECFRIEENDGDANETSLKEERVIQIETTVLPLRDARSLRLNYLHS